MRRIVFYVDSGYVGATRKEVYEFGDDATEDDVQLAYNDWVSQYCGWWELEDGEDLEKDRW